MQKKKILLIGCGIWGVKILKNLIDLSAEVFVVETNKENRSAALALGAAECLTQLPEKADYDGVIIATPSTTHRQILEEVIPWNLPVFVEKPLTTSFEDALALAALPVDKVFLMHVWLYHPGIQMLATIAREEILGKVLGVRTSRCNWTSPRTDTDSVWNLAPHDVTIAKAIFGYIPVPQAAVVESHGTIARGMMAILGKQPFSIFEVSNRYMNKNREVRLHCENGIAVLKDEQVDYVELVFGDAGSKPEDVRIEKRSFVKTQPLFLELQEFLAYLDGGPAPKSSFADGLEVVKTIHELKELAGPGKLLPSRGARL